LNSYSIVLLLNITLIILLLFGCLYVLWIDLRNVCWNCFIFCQPIWKLIISWYIPNLHWICNKILRFCILSYITIILLILWYISIVISQLILIILKLLNRNIFIAACYIYLWIIQISFSLILFLNFWRLCSLLNRLISCILNFT